MNKSNLHDHGEKHTFAFFCPPLRRNHPNPWSLDDEHLVHRIQSVLRLQPGEHIVLFDGIDKALATIERCDKRSVVVTTASLAPCQRLSPLVHWYVPILQRASFEQVVASLTAMGAASIVPVISVKSKRSLSGDYERLMRVSIAAAEQSKQYVLPKIVEPRALEAITAQPPFFYFDPSGDHTWQVLSRVREQGFAEISCMIGPEGDLTMQEKDFLRSQGVQFCALTPTVLEAWQAAIVAMGIIRSCV